jgi:hypothetical protein
MQTGTSWQRQLQIVSFAEEVKATEVYGFAGNSGKVNLEGQLLAGDTPSDTVFIFMHPASTDGGWPLMTLDLLLIGPASP